MAIVPSRRLVLWAAVVGLPSAAMAAAVPGVSGAALVAIAAFVLSCALDAAFAHRSLAGLEVELPSLVRASRNAETRISLRIGNRIPKARALRIGLPFPRQIHSPREEMAVAVPPHEGDFFVPWVIFPLERGRFALDAAYLEALSPLGFWGVRARLPSPCEIRVYPDLSLERRNVSALFLRRGAYGVRAHRRVGKGREFEKLREYVPGDAYDEIHWKASAKRGRPITKVFQLERTQEVYVAVDASRLSARGVSAPGPAIGSGGTGGSGGIEPEMTILERCITAALVLGLAAERANDLFGLLVFTSGVDCFLRARGGKAHYGACRDALYTLKPRLVNPDFEEVCAFIRSRLRKRALIVFLTSLDDPFLAESFVENADIIRRHHLVLVNMLRPPGAAPLFADLEVESASDVYERLAGHIRWSKLRVLEKVLRKRGVGFALVEDERLTAELVSRYVEVKRRQAL